MRLLLLAGCCALWAFGATNALVSAGVMLYWSRRRGAAVRRSASSLLLLRSLAAALSFGFAALIVLPSFLAHEPRARVEAVGLPLALGAVPACVILASGLARGLRDWSRTRAAVRAWTRSATPVELAGWSGRAWIVDDSAGVCVAGLLRPQLLLPRSLFARCTPLEIRAIVAHERAHVASFDNWKKAVVRFLPDLLPGTRTAREIERARNARSEEEADRRASEAAPRLALELAGALVKLAGLRSSSALPLATAFDAGGPIARRVRLLLHDVRPGRDGRGGWVALALGTLAAPLLCALLPGLSGRVHQVFETLVQLLT